MTESAQPGGTDAAARSGSSRLVVHWAAKINEQGGPMRWLGSWLHGGDGSEGDWFYGGWGSEATEHEIPAEATGVRIRKWVSEGLDPEYVDVPFDGRTVLRTEDFDFDTPQPHRLLVVSAGSG